MFNVGDPFRNAVLIGCFLAIMMFTVAALVPWKSLGAPRLSRLARWLPVPVFLLALVYETTMPARFDIRVDLLLLLPMYGLVIAASIVRWCLSRRA